MRNHVLALRGKTNSTLKAVAAPVPAASTSLFASPYLRFVLAGHTRQTQVYSLRQIKDLIVQTVKPFVSPLPHEVEEGGNEWYNHYE
jgi:hypothetical protein